MDLLSKAIELAAKYHAGQVDKGGNPYILHPLRMMMKATTTDEKIVAVLHDVFEDTELTPLMLQDEGFPTHLTTAILHLTRDHGQTYNKFIESIKKNELASIVKVLDIEDNMDLSRIPNPTDSDLSRIKRYEKALEILKPLS